MRMVIYISMQIYRYMNVKKESSITRCFSNRLYLQPVLLLHGFFLNGGHLFYHSLLLKGCNDLLHLVIKSEKSIGLQGQATNRIPSCCKFFWWLWGIYPRDTKIYAGNQWSQQMSQKRRVNQCSGLSPQEFAFETSNACFMIAAYNGRVYAIEKNKWVKKVTR